MLLKDANLDFIRSLRASPQGGDEPYETLLLRISSAATNSGADQMLISSTLYRIEEAMELSRARELIGKAIEGSSSGGLVEAWTIIHDRWSSLYSEIRWDTDKIERERSAD